MATPRLAAMCPATKANLAIAQTLNCIRSKKPKAATLVDLINPKLCDKIVDRLKLKDNYTGTTIIDMNPGLGIFSKTLYERLKPKSHILLEPYSAYQDHLREFIKPYPKMSLVGLDGYDWSSYVQLFKGEQYSGPEFGPGFVPPRPRTVPAEEGLNTDILFVGNLTRLDGAQRLTSQLLSTCFNRTWLQQFGRVRFLLWMHDLEKERIIPQAIQGRTRPSAVADTVVELTEVAGSGTVRHGKGFSVSKLSPTQDKVEETPPKKKPPKSTVERLGYAVEKELQKQQEWIARRDSGRNGMAARYKVRAPLIEQAVRKALCTFLAHVDKIVHLAAEGEHNPYRDISTDELLSRYRAAMLDAQKSPEQRREEAEKAAGLEFTQEERESFAEFEEEYLLATTGDRQRANSFFDETYARTLDPPLLQAWERRNNNPVIVDPNTDVHPHRPIALLDFQPKLIPEWFRDESSDEVNKRFAAYDRLVRAIFALRAQTLKAALKTLAPGAESVLMSMPDGKELGKRRVRCLTTAELVRIAQAWKEWPFRSEEDDHMVGYNRKTVSDDGHSRLMLR
ncbi:ribosomal RNA adenine dimethylase-domain-containing protein [Sphaerosporella brunnea]|uniref:rRNA adenine N(6)-methyltransferase n=1 Tax=Sphaerosporella brunnea TaxID=1250544 RepID=A0A5J5ERM2_9PEZI|nr:ribosomal RNA adenine dimethylase-domain-containing protein [Sphaerosporella brunnea]